VAPTLRGAIPLSFAERSLWPAPPGHEGHSRVLAEDPQSTIDHHPEVCPCCQAALSADLPSEVVSQHDRIDVPVIKPVVERHRRLAVQCPACGTRVAAAVPEVARGTPFGPRVHAAATYLKTFQALSYERLQGTFLDLFGLSISQGGLMNMLRRAQDRFAPGRDAALAALRRAVVVASDETGVRIEGSNAFHWIFRCAEAVVHRAVPTRGAVVVRDTMDGHRPAVWLSDRYGAQQNHADRQQTCLAHLARDVAYALGASDDPLPLRLKLWLLRRWCELNTSGNGIIGWRASIMRRMQFQLRERLQLSAMDGANLPVVWSMHTSSASIPSGA